MDTNSYEYISYTCIRRRMKDRGAIRANLFKTKNGGDTNMQLSVTLRRNHDVQCTVTGVSARPFSLPTGCSAQDNVPKDET